MITKNVIGGNIVKKKMIVELFIFFELITIGLFVAAFFTKQEILWALTAVMSGILMATSYHIESSAYYWNVTAQSYYPITQSHSYPYLMGLNLMFFVLAVILGIFDLFDKYGTKM